ncbi:MAG: DUF99 family protein [archaeon]|nr:DUF99 family protein [archaeon]
MKHLKKWIRVIGFDDGPFKHKNAKDTILVGVIVRMKEYLDGILSARIEIDGLDVTEKIIFLVNRPKFKDQIQIIILNSIAFGGFNLADIKKINLKTGKPVIAVVRKKPDREKFIKAASKLPDAEKRLEIIENAGEIKEAEVDGRKLYYQSAGIDDTDAAVILRKTRKRSAIPEPVRMAHIIASGIVDGESRGRV